MRNRGISPARTMASFVGVVYFATSQASANDSAIASYPASSPGPFPAFNVARWKAGGPGARAHVPYVKPEVDVMHVILSFLRYIFS